MKSSLLSSLSASPPPRATPMAVALLLTAMCLIAWGGDAFAASTDSQDAKALFRRANQAYDAEEYQQARDFYLQILTRAPANPVVEYNVGNAFARLGDTARAVLHYERALKNNPRMTDARRNLLRLAPPSNHPDVSPLALPFRWIQWRMNVNEWLVFTFIVLLFSSVTASLWALDTVRARAWKWVSISLAVLLLLVIPFGGVSVSSAMQPKGIVMSDKTDARSGPGRNYLEAMELPAGAKVIAAGEPQRGWIKIRTLDGNTAYVRSADVEWI